LSVLFLLLWCFTTRMTYCLSVTIAVIKTAEINDYADITKIEY